MSQPTVIAPSAIPQPALQVETGPILVAVKPLDGHEGALGMGRWLAQQTQRELHLVSIVEPPDASAALAGVPPLSVGHYRVERDEVVKTLRERLEESVLPPASRRLDVLDGSVSSCIANLGRDRGASVIVVGTGRHGALGRFLYGERALEILRQSVRPVLVVAPSARVPLRRAIVAVDFSQASLRAAAASLAMLTPGGRLTLVHVESALRLDEASIGWFDAEYEQRASRMLERFSAALPAAPDVSVDTTFLRGDAVDMLLGYAAREDADLIACGRLRHPLVVRLLIGSTSAALVRRGPRAVLVAPEQPYDNELDAGSWLTGVTVSRTPDAWPAFLRRFSERNTGRPAQLTLDAGKSGTTSVERGYVLLGVDYDRRTVRADIMLGDPMTMGSHVTHCIAGLRSLELVSDMDGRDLRLELDGAAGRYTLTLAA